MNWFTDRHFFLLAVIGYGLSTVYSVFLWRKGFRRDDHINYFLLLAAFALHTTAMIKRGFSIASCPVNNLYEATTFISWTIVAAYLVLGIYRPLRFLGAFAAPVLLAIGVFALMPDLDRKPAGAQPDFSHGLVSLHAATILLAYGAFGLGATAAGMFLTQQHDLKFHKLRAVLSLLPPIQRLETVTFRLVLAGFVLFSIGLAAGPLLTESDHAKDWGDPKVVWSVLLWLVYLAVIAGHYKRLQSSRAFAATVIAVFLFLLLTFWGVNLLSPLHHPMPS
ncbi:MAG: cytochrome c biogenesis protein CcsA [Verrucomicrobia bacterium]|nr:cytochrome c biogenesis protein CcsA [Verrucomicrobiota bacterium]MDE3099418.1 cytochrome c biogenesis protein CcsA [Verrucomicrobiota bacterium]